MLRVVIVTALLATAAQAFVFKASLPVYIQRCSRSDPNLNQCFVDNGNVAIQQLVRGDQRYGIPNMVPLELPEVILSDTNELRFILRNVQVFGLDKARLSGVNVDFESGAFQQNLTIPKLTFIGDYELDGQILDEYVQGNGRASITIVSGLYTTQLEFRTENNRVVPANSYTFYRPQIVLYDLQNLYDGNEFRASYFEICRQSNPQLFACIVNAGNKVIPRIVKGDYHYGIPNMLPLKLQEVVIANNPQLRFILRNVEVRGLETAKMVGAYLSPAHNEFRYNFTIPNLNIIGDYELRGRVAEVLVNGLGRANITILNALYINGFTFTLDPETYVKNFQPYGDYIPQRVIYHFSNLQSGNDFLGYQTNIYLNNNWAEVSRAFHFGAARSIIQFVTSIFENIAQVTSFIDALPVSKL